MTRIDELFVLWQPQKRRHVIGTLSRIPGAYVFRYADDLAEAEAAGFDGLVGFPLPRREFRAPHLFAAFSHRIPSPLRTDFAALLRAGGVEDPDDPFEILAKSGGLQVMDRVELAEYRAPDDRLDTPLSFRIAGPAYGDDPTARATEAGEAVELIPEPSNEWDRSAVTVRSRDGTKLGYVPRQYSSIVSSLVAAGESILAQATRKLLVPGEGYRWIIRAQRA
jgi:hypothetical protein